MGCARLCPVPSSFIGVRAEDSALNPRVTRVRSRSATLGADLHEHGGPVDCMGREAAICYRWSERGPADQPDKAQRLRNCCWQPAGIPLENLRAILRPFDSPLITPFRTPWRSQVSPISWRNPRVTVPRTTRATPPLIRMTKTARGYKATQRAHATSVASPSCRKSATSFRYRHNLLWNWRQAKGTYYLAEKGGDMLAAIDDLDGAADRTHHFLAGVDFERMAQGREEIGDGHGVILDVRSVGA